MANESLGALSVLLDNTASAIPWRKDALASGGEQAAVDSSTGLEGITIDAGYTWNVLFYLWRFNQLAYGYEEYDGAMVGKAFEEAFKTTYLDNIRPNYGNYDPTGALGHTWGVTWKNLGDDDMEGYFTAPYILVEVGTVRKETKTVACSFCGAQRIVDRKATKVRCYECGEVSFYMPRLFGMKETPITEVVE